MDSLSDGLKSSYRNYIPHEPKPTFVDTKIHGGEHDSSIIHEYFPPQLKSKEEPVFSSTESNHEPHVIDLTDQIKDPDHPNIYLP